MIQKFVKRFLFPGLDLHTRSRYRWLPRYFIPGAVDTLDVGCGNGALCYAAYKKGNHVLGVNYDSDERNRCLEFFSSFTSPEKLRFQVLNAYDLLSLDRQFDQIICSEALEHISNDKLVVGHIYKLLKPGGTFHLCCPNAMHPEHNLGRTDNPEDGGHVRDGYTLESYKRLLEPIGFQIETVIGLGAEAFNRADMWIRKVRHRYGNMAAVPLFLFIWPFLRLLDKPESIMPFSIYVKAVKQKEGSSSETDVKS